MATRWHVLNQCHDDFDWWQSFTVSRSDEIDLWGFGCQKQVSQAWISKCIPQYSVGYNYLSMPEIPASGTKILIQEYASGIPSRWLNIRVKTFDSLATQLFVEMFGITTKYHQSSALLAICAENLPVTGVMIKVGQCHGIMLDDLLLSEMITLYIWQLSEQTNTHTYWNSYEGNSNISFILNLQLRHNIGLAQGCSNFIVNTLQVLQSCAKP